MNKKQKVAKGARMVPLIFVLMIVIGGLGPLVSACMPLMEEDETSLSIKTDEYCMTYESIRPAELNITDPSEEPCKITTDKYTYYVGEPVYITITGYRSGSSTSFSRGYTIKDSGGEWVRDGPWLVTMDVMVSYYPAHFTWYQKYELDCGCPPWENLSIHYPKNGQQVSTGKYYIYACPGNCEPAEIEIIERPKEPLKITTDKYTYYQGEPVHITITGFRVGPSSDFTRGYLIKDELGYWVRDPTQIHTTDVFESWGPGNHIWNQKYDLLYEYDIYGNYLIHFPENGNQVPQGKYYIYACPGNCEPAEIEIIERPIFVIEKVKISGPDEIFTHTYYEWELKITVYNNQDGYINSVEVNDVLPAELELQDYDLTQGELSITKKGNGKMGATHLTWYVGDLSDKAELIIKIATRKNPACKQEFTSPGRYVLNDGAKARGINPCTGKKLVAGPSPPIYVKAIERIPKQVPLPLPSLPTNKNKDCSKITDNDALGNQGNVRSTDPIQPSLTLLMILGVFILCMFMTCLEVRFAEHLFDNKLL